MIDGGTFVQVSEGYDLLPIVKERDAASGNAVSHATRVEIVTTLSMQGELSP
jgi:hypothetical protein